MSELLGSLINDFLPYAKEKMGFSEHPRIFLKKDQQNSENIFGKTAYYNPETKVVVLYITDRHPKDILRSLSHELVHHSQNLRGDMATNFSTNPGYAQENGHLRGLEEEAYLKGNMCFRDYEDEIKKNVANKKLYKEYLELSTSPVSAKEKNNKILLETLSNKWGFNFKL